MKKEQTEFDVLKLAICGVFGIPKMPNRCNTSKSTFWNVYNKLKQPEDFKEGTIVYKYALAGRMYWLLEANFNYYTEDIIDLYQKQWLARAIKSHMRNASNIKHIPPELINAYVDFRMG